MKCPRIACLVVLATALFPAAARAGFTNIVAFGDSLSDTGNVYLATGGTTPASPPYYLGHYSNGPVWLEQFAGLDGLPVPTASLAGGTDYAFGGAETGTSGMSSQGTPNIGTQITTFLAGHTLNQNNLITIWGGANDFLNAGQTNPLVPVMNLVNEITTLANAGGKSFMVLNLPSLGTLPATSGLPQAQRDALNQLTQVFNTQLFSQLDQLSASLGITVHKVDINSLLAAAEANPSLYGFTNVTQSSLGNGDTTGKGYLFWDSVHPTTAADTFIAHAALASLPEPSSVVLMVIGAGALAVPGLRSLRSAA